MDYETREYLADICGTIFIYGSEEVRAKAQRDHSKDAYLLIDDHKEILKRGDIIESR